MQPSLLGKRNWSRKWRDDVLSLSISPVISCMHAKQNHPRKPDTRLNFTPLNWMAPGEIETVNGSLAALSPFFVSGPCPYSPTSSYARAHGEGLVWPSDETDQVQMYSIVGQEAPTNGAKRGSGPDVHPCWSRSTNCAPVSAKIQRAPTRGPSMGQKLQTVGRAAGVCLYLPAVLLPCFRSPCLCRPGVLLWVLRLTGARPNNRKNLFTVQRCTFLGNASQ